MPNQSAARRLLYSVREASDALGVSDITVRRMLDRGDIVKVRLGRRVMIPVQSVEKFIRNQVTAATRRGRK